MSEIQRVQSFVNRIGIPCLPFNRQHNPKRFRTFLNGICIYEGKVLFDASALDFEVGDILHEAGHLAVIPAQFRRYATYDVETSCKEHFDAYIAAHPNGFGYPEDATCRAIMQAGEQEAIAWSFAAALAAKVQPEAIFHGSSYGEDTKGLIDSLRMGFHVGIHGLHAAGMTVLPHISRIKNAFPQMVKWVQD